MKPLVIVLLIALCVLHHDVWWWDTPRPLVFGFVPIGLAWHAGISVAAGVVWWLAIKFCWPSELAESEDAQAPEAGSKNGEDAR